ncbi:hypothetical protein Slin14017_G015630 [Septoria linicola]|nr:hypothetical protein Slin14017_G015630 [Septoria linicola]
MTEPPKVATSTTSPEIQFQNYELSKRSNVLPPIAHLKQHGGPLYSAVNDIVGASISASPACRCAAIKPLLYNVIESVHHLRQRLHSARGDVANYGGPEYPDGNPVHNVQWILDQLCSANGDLDALFSLRKTDDSRDLRATQSLPSPGELKRKGDCWDGTDEVHKRARFGPVSDLPDHHSVSDRSDRARGEQPQGYSSTPTDSLPGSAYPRNVSPSQPHRAMRALPSPSSIALPGSAGSTLPALAAQSIGSPATSYQAATSTNTFAASSITSAHIADLQHQVTLKSLALQTLQTEYASLLQKLQREKVKSQTIERKTTVADQEVNELTSKNEDLAEQLKQVTTQLEDSEKKRDMERVEAQREKDQWGRMLEMSGRLQAKVDAERQRLLAEKEELLSRISQSEQDRKIVSKPWQTTNSKGKPTDTPPRHPVPMALESAPNSTPDSETSMTRQHIAALNARIEALKTALSHIRTQSVSIDEKAQLLHKQSGALNQLIADALEADNGPR